MLVSGQGITGYKHLKVLPKFKVKTTYAIKWAQTSSGAWVGTDRGATEDRYEADITLHGREEDISEVLQYLDDNRTVSHADAHKLTLTNVAVDEKIFGVDVDYSSGVTATVIKWGERKQTLLHSHEVSMTLLCISPSFTGSGAASVSFASIDIGYSSDASWELTKYRATDGTVYYLDHYSDAGKIEGIVTLSTADAITFRRTLATERAAAITTTVINGVNFPTRSSRGEWADWADEWPKNLKFVKVEDGGRFGLNYHKFKIMAVEDL